MLALERSNSAGGDHRIERPGLAPRNMACSSSIFNPPELSAVDRRFPAAQHRASEDQRGSLSLSSTSSIWENSDNSTSGVRGDGEEVQSEYKGGPLEGLETLEIFLPINLSDAASCPSIEDITKPENAYYLLAFNNILDKNSNNILRSCNGGISKRPNNSRSMLALAATMNCSHPNTGETSCSNSSSPGCCRPPLPPHARRAMHCEPSVFSPVDMFSSWRSFSLCDLQGAAAASKPSIA